MVQRCRDAFPIRVTEADEHGTEEMIRVHFIKVNFYRHGLWDAEQKRDELREAMQALGGSDKSDWAELYRPTQDIIEEVSEMVRLKKKHS